MFSKKPFIILISKDGYKFVAKLFLVFIKGDEILAKEEQFALTPLQLHCVTSRLGMAAPTCGRMENG